MCWTDRLSQKATESGCQLKRTWKAGFVLCANSRSSTTRPSSGDSSLMCIVKFSFTNSALRPVTGWMRTTGCTACGNTALTVVDAQDPVGPAIRAVAGMGGGQAAQEFLECWCERIVGRCLAGEDRVAADRWHRVQV